MFKKLAMSGLKVLATKEGRKMAKEAFRTAFKKHKREVRRSKKIGTPVVPYNLIKSDVKRKIKGTKLVAKAEIKATPGLRRRIMVNIERGRREKKKYVKPKIFGKAYASDKAAKRTLQIQPLTFKQRRLMKKEMAAAADRNYKRVRLRKFGYKSGGIKKERI